MSEEATKASAQKAGATGTATNAKAPKSLLSKLKPLLGLAILVVVLSQLPYQDRLEYRNEAGEVLVIPGEITGGEWQSTQIEFRPEAEWVVPDDAPPLLRAWDGESSVAVERVLDRAEAEDGASGAGYTWSPRMQRVFASLQGKWLALAMGLFILGNLCVITRWWRLLRSVGVPATWWNTFRLNFLGFFFNAVVPGLTGGDLVKALIIVRENPLRKADAFVSVIVDRLLGLGSMILLAAAVIFVSPAFAELRLWVAMVTVIGFTGAGIYAHRGLRKALGFDALLAKLPLGDKLKLLDDALLLYSNHKRELALGVLISICNHLSYIGGTACLGIGFGQTLERIGILDWLAIVPVANILSAVPLSPGGWGVGELIYIGLFAMIGTSASVAVAISLAFRICQLALGLFGGIFLLLPGARQELAEAEQSAGPGAF